MRNEYEARLAELAEYAEREAYGDPFGQYDTPRPKPITATPFAWPDPATIPRRQWLLGHWLLRGEITAIVAPSGRRASCTEW